jgi:hypothetical protein
MSGKNLSFALVTNAEENIRRMNISKDLRFIFETRLSMA